MNLPACARGGTGIIPLICLLPVTVVAQLRVLSGTAPQRVFASQAQNIAVHFHNPASTPAVAELYTRLYQASSATAVPVAGAAWKKLQVLPGQTVLESAALDFPAVKAETQFIVQWLEGTNHVLGTTSVLAYPPDLLKELKPLSGEKPLGVFDPQNQLKPLLKAARVEAQDLEEAGLENYTGTLAIIGPFKSSGQMRESLANRNVRALAQRGVTVVWIQPPPEKPAGFKPSFYTVPAGKGVVVVVQADLVANPAGDPQAQLNLLRFCRLALHPEPLELPSLTSSP